MKNILVVEDDIHIGNALEETLISEGYGVLRAYSGTEAVLVLAGAGAGPALARTGAGSALARAGASPALTRTGAGSALARAGASPALAGAGAGSALARTGADPAYVGTSADFAAGTRPDLVLLDLMLPGLSGEEVLSRLRELWGSQEIPVIVMSARGDVESKVELLLGGAVDYVTKPFQMKELLARIAVHLRTFHVEGQAEGLRFGDIEIRTDIHRAIVRDTDLRLTRTEYAILKLLVENQTRVLTKSVLLDSISEDTPDCSESSLKMHISNLRRKLKEAGCRESIEAVWGIGFQLKSGQNE